MEKRLSRPKIQTETLLCFAKTSFDWQTVASTSRRSQTRLAMLNAIVVSIRFILLILWSQTDRPGPHAGPYSNNAQFPSLWPSWPAALQAENITLRHLSLLRTASSLRLLTAH